MGESQNNEQRDEPDAEGSESDGTINDPITRTDMEAPRVPFGDDPAD